MGNSLRTNENGTRETSRLEAFSDAVFAIAITLLVLELIQFLHPRDGESLVQSYLHHWEPFVAYIIGFLTILVCWINHHHVFTYIRKTDSNLPWVNGFVLLIITFTPLPTAILAEYLGTEGKSAIAFYGFNYFMISVASFWLCSYAYRKSLVDGEKREFFIYVRRTYAISIFYTLFAFLICFLWIPAALALYLLLFVAFAFPKEFATLLLNRKALSIRKSEKRRNTPPHKH